jgi:hypothetical protein
MSKLSSTQKLDWIALYNKIKKLPEPKVPCVTCGTGVTMFSTNLEARVTKFKGISNLLNNFVCRNCTKKHNPVKNKKAKKVKPEKQVKEEIKYDIPIMVKAPVVVYQFNEIADNEERVKYVTNGNCPQPHIYLDNGKYCNGCCLYRYCACTIKRLNNKMNHEFAR